MPSHSILYGFKQLLCITTFQFWYRHGFLLALYTHIHCPFVQVLVYMPTSYFNSIDPQVKWSFIETFFPSTMWCSSALLYILVVTGVTDRLSEGTRVPRQSTVYYWLLRGGGCLNEQSGYCSHAFAKCSHYFDKEVKVLDVFTFSPSAMTTYFWTPNWQGGGA